jgi:hypothetical protein
MTPSSAIDHVNDLRRQLTKVREELTFHTQNFPDDRRMEFQLRDAAWRISGDLQLAESDACVLVRA